MGSGAWSWARGEAGAGKTTLLGMFRDQVPHGVLHCACGDLLTAPPFGPLARTDRRLRPAAGTRSSRRRWPSCRPDPDGAAARGPPLGRRRDAERARLPGPAAGVAGVDRPRRRAEGASGGSGCSPVLRTAAERAGYALQPTSNGPQLARALLDALQLPPLHTISNVVAFDLEQVTLDLSPIPLDEVLDFRHQHGAEYRTYARNLRQFVRELAPLDQEARDQAFADRREDLADTADQLRRLGRKAWNRPLATFGLGIAGTAVSLAHGNLITAGLSAASSLLGLRRQADPASAYTYIFRAQDQLSRRYNGQPTTPTNRDARTCQREPVPLPAPAALPSTEMAAQ